VAFGTPDGEQDRLQIAVPATADDELARALRAGRHVATPSARLVLELARGRRLFDLGAHLGTVALPAARLGARVLAVEPSPRNHAALAESVRRTGLPVDLVQAAVSDVPGTLHLVEDGPFTRVREAAGPGTVAVPTVTLGDLARRAGGLPDVLKIDVEGHELEVLRGLDGLLASAEAAPAVVVESNGHVLRLRGRSPRALAGRLRELGLTVYLIEDGCLRHLADGALQPEAVVDLLALAGPPPWPLGPPLTPGECARRLAAELRHDNRWHRAWAAAELGQAPEALRSDRGLRRALDAALVDEIDDVREAAAWWRAQRPGRPGVVDRLLRRRAGSR
jgi:FkbM family methyltransferase